MPPQPCRTRLSIDISAESRRRLRIAAARRDQSIRDYVWEAVAARLDREAPTTTGAARSLDPTAEPDSGRVADSPSAGGHLSGRADPVLAELWMNAEDAIYDDM